MGLADDMKAITDAAQALVTISKHITKENNQDCICSKVDSKTKDVKKCFCETLKEILGNSLGVGEELKDFTLVKFAYDEEGNPMYGNVHVCMYYWKKNNYTLHISTEFEALEIPINYCPFCGRKLK